MNEFTLNREKKVPSVINLEGLANIFVLSIKSDISIHIATNE